MKLLSITKLDSVNYPLAQKRCSNQLTTDTVSFQSRTKLVKAADAVQKESRVDLFKLVQNMLNNDKTRQLYMRVTQALLGAAVITEFLTTGKDTDTKKLLKEELRKAGVDVDAILQEQQQKKTRVRKNSTAANEAEAVEKPKAKKPGRKPMSAEQPIAAIGTAKTAESKGEEKAEDIKVTVKVKGAKAKVKIKSSTTEKLKAGRKPKYTEEELKEKIQTLADKGMIQAQIAVVLGLSKSYTAKLMRNLNIQTNRSKTYGTNKKEVVNKYIEENPTKKDYIKYLAKFPKLYERYTDVILTHSNEPENLEASEKLDLLEQIFENLYTKNRKIQPLNTKYYEALETRYSDDLDLVCQGFKTHLKNNGGVYGYLSYLQSEKVEKSDIENYIECGVLSFGDFLNHYESLDKDTMQAIQEIKDKGNIERIFVRKSNFFGDRYVAKVTFDDGAPLKEKIGELLQIYKVLYGNVPDIPVKEIDSPLQLRKELVKHTKYDQNLDFSYYVVRFLSPEKTAKYREEHENLPRYIADLEPTHPEYAELQYFLRKNMKNIKLDDEKFMTLYNVFSNKEIFSETLQNDHARLRFLGRFVLKSKPTPERLDSAMKNASITLDRELNFRLNTGCKIFPYVNYTNEISPSLYLGSTSLGSYIRIIFDKDGHAQTMFKDVPYNIKNQDRDQESVPLQQ